MRPSLLLRAADPSHDPKPIHEAPHVPPGRYPYPKEVWSPAGGWWSQPKNWRTNTAIASGFVFLVAVATFRYGAEHEHWIQNPSRWIPSMMWSKDFKTGRAKIDEY